MVLALVRIVLLVGIKVVSRCLWAFTVEWVGRRPAHPFRDARIGLLLNHTSLYEPLFLGVLPIGWLWQLSVRGLLPGADSTLDRPIVGRVFKWMTPYTISISRARDATWRHFMSLVSLGTVVLMAPEGRMKRADGLDKHGRKMTVRGGIADILDRMEDGTIAILYSGGLHHVQTPGDPFPRVFRRVFCRIEEMPIARYKKEMGHGTPEFRANVMADLDRRRDRHSRWD